MINLELSVRNVLIIIKNYYRILKNILQFLTYSGLIVFFSLIITLPLWYAATKYGKAYTWTMILLLIFLVLFLTVMRIKKWYKKKKLARLNLRMIILIPIKRIAAFILSVTGLYAIAYIYLKGLILAAVILTVVYILLAGYLIFVNRKRNA